MPASLPGPGPSDPYAPSAATLTLTGSDPCTEPPSCPTGPPADGDARKAGPSPGLGLGPGPCAGGTLP